MENNRQQKTIKENILSTIKSGEIKMRPKWHFVLKTALAILGGAILALTILYLASFIIFFLRQTGLMFVPAFGWQGWYVFFSHLPIFLIILVLAFIVVLELLVRHYAFAYRRPLLYSAIGIFALVLIGSLMMANSRIHGGMLRYADNNKDTTIGRFYSDYGRPRFTDVHRGMIVNMMNDGFLMQDRREETMTVIITRRTRLPFGADFTSGDIVVVFGPLTDNNIIQAFGIQEIDGSNE